MAKLLTDEAKAFRRLIEEFDGDQYAIAAALGVTQSAVSHRLHTELHGAWWKAFKRKRSKRRKREAQARYRRGARARMAAAWGQSPLE